MAGVVVTSVRMMVVVVFVSMVMVVFANVAGLVRHRCRQVGSSAKCFLTIFCTFWPRQGALDDC